MTSMLGLGIGWLVGVVIMYAVILGIIFAFLWVVWNYIIVPTIPYIATLF